MKTKQASRKPIATIRIDGESYKIEGYEIAGGNTVKMFSADTVIAVRCMGRVGVPLGEMTKFETLDKHGQPFNFADDERKDERGDVFILKSIRPKTRAEGGCKACPIASITLGGKKYRIESYDFTSYAPPIMRLYTDMEAIDIETLNNKVVRLPKGKLTGGQDADEPDDEWFCVDERDDLYQVRNVRPLTASEKSGEPCAPPPPKKTTEQIVLAQINELYAMLATAKHKRAAAGRRAGRRGGRPTKDDPDAVEAAIRYAIEQSKRGLSVKRACEIACGHFAVDATERQPYTVTLTPPALEKHVRARLKKRGRGK